MGLSPQQQNARTNALKHMQQFISSGETDLAHLQEAKKIMKNVKLTLNKTAPPEVLAKIKPHWEKIPQTS
ncbi:MAG: hypothetical protein KBC42_03095 [Candidatus Pacebacteria bacterium]|nr:hypothetical protein [Candidatus Paceibacterota bacterium]MBP9780886.1 hypothetical protein [Candidatus Paceibacterota bacterium]